MKNKFLLIAFLSLSIYLLSLIVPSVSFADGVSCQPIYGGGQTCVTVGNILINKKVLNPATNTFVDNLGINDPQYSPEFLVNFRLELTNTGNINISRIDVKDIFPQYVQFSSGTGVFDQNTRTLSFTTQNLAPNETRTFIIIGKIVPANQLPMNQGMVCVVNQVTAVTNDNATSNDNSQFCIKNVVPTTKGGFPLTTTPPTGPESLALFSLIPTGLTGLFMRKYASKVNFGKRGK